MVFHIYDLPYMNTVTAKAITPIQFYKCLADDTRLKTLFLVQQQGELCVCEITEALGLSQPKVSRHLSQLRECGILQDSRKGQWVYYRLHPELPAWASEVLAQTVLANPDYLGDFSSRAMDRAGENRSTNACC